MTANSEAHENGHAHVHVDFCSTATGPGPAARGAAHPHARARERTLQSCFYNVLKMPCSRARLRLRAPALSLRPRRSTTTYGTRSPHVRSCRSHASKRKLPLNPTISCVCCVVGLSALSSLPRSPPKSPDVCGWVLGTVRVRRLSGHARHGHSCSLLPFN